ncbi:hypothetical protein AAVH_08213 [Aphelenchoides avenae]|nr:hypothetical protein AAVH_08213 [Aphelenchus avenae]
MTLLQEETDLAADEGIANFMKRFEGVMQSLSKEAKEYVGSVSRIFVSDGQPESAEDFAMRVNASMPQSSNVGGPVRLGLWGAAEEFEKLAPKVKLELKNAFVEVMKMLQAGPGPKESEQEIKRT